MKDRTSLIIAHKHLVLLSMQTKLLLWKKGSIQAIGSHQELLSKSPSYKAFIDMQSLN